MVVVRASVLRMEMLDPVRRHRPGRPRHRLLDRMVPWRGEGRAGHDVVVPEVPEPVLARFEALHVAVAGRAEVGARVPARRGVTTAHLAAVRATAQVEPPPRRSAGQALLATLAGRPDGRTVGSMPTSRVMTAA